MLEELHSISGLNYRALSVWIRVVPDIGIPSLSRDLAMTGLLMANHVPKTTQSRDLARKPTCRANDGNGLLLVEFRHHDNLVGLLGQEGQSSDVCLFKVSVVVVVPFSCGVIRIRMLSQLIWLKMNVHKQYRGARGY